MAPSSSRPRPSSDKKGRSSCNVSIWVMILSNLLVFQLMSSSQLHKRFSLSITDDQDEPSSPLSASLGRSIDSSSLTTNNNPLLIPRGQAKNLPSIRITSSKEQVNRDQPGGLVYGGKGDKAHLGGFTELDLQGVSPATWKDMIEWFGVKSVVDVGCGRGISTSWFHLHGVDSLCVEGSHDAVTRTLLPNPETQIVEHDFSRGPWWPTKTYDAVWCVEFLEHVGRNFHKNYIPVFRKAGIIFASHSIWGGWHHVEVHLDDWWITKMQMYGFIYSKELTDHVRQVARGEAESGIDTAPNGEKYNAQHVWLNMLVFINPAVASLPQHAHLMAEGGCFESQGKNGKLIHRPCGSGNGHEEETPLAQEFLSLELSPEMDKAWEELVKKNIATKDEEPKK